MRREISVKQVQVTDGFWTPIQKLMREVVLPYQLDIMDDKIPGVEKSHALENLRIAAGDSNEPFYGMVFQDSDVAKWLEAVSYTLADSGEIEMWKRAEEVISLMARAQQPDGYLNSYFTAKEPEHRWQNLQECHELYCAGHLIEAGVAHYEATGTDHLLAVTKKLADHICARFGKEKVRGIPGHEEIELALLRLYHATGEARYLETAQYFIDERGVEPDYFQEEVKARNWTHWNLDGSNRLYAQNHAPVREQTAAEGHSVRAVYLYAAMAGIAAETGDQALADACERLFLNITQKRMYITGGIGSTVEGEAFTMDYDLPNDSIYAETCASVGLIFFARQMLELSSDGRYGDIMERALYNGVLSGMQLDGKRFFYVNPLEVVPGVSGKLHGYQHALPRRPKWYACACCPPNVARLVTSLGKYAWGYHEKTIYAHLYLGGSFDFPEGRISCESNYPASGTIRYTLHPTGDHTFTFALRIPDWCKDFTVTHNGKSILQAPQKGYLHLSGDFSAGDVVELKLSMPVRRLYANTAVRADAGCVALMRGPVVYCLEQVDNGGSLSALRLPRTCVIHEETADFVPVPILKTEGIRMEKQDSLYSETPPDSQIVPITAIPYYAWGNRDEGEMRVWIRE